MKEQQHSIERLNLILDSTLEGWWEWNVVENTSYHSPQWYVMLGYTKDEFESTFNVWKELMHPDDQEDTIKKQSEYMQNTDKWELEFRMRCKNGTYKWILSRGRTVERNNRGEAMKLVGIHLDITERKKTELLKGIIKVSPAAFKTYYFLQKKMIYSSHMVAKFLDYTPEEFEQFSQDFVEQLIHPEDVKLIEDALKKLIHNTGNEIVECFFRLKKRNGEYIWAKT
ncbi:MAG TPA: PAS domain-containing protein, partial [Cytophagaceae bacterium]|nr:PAS domain-containing protein [Cytophagaceae bacterium]